jgi:hypothetical protein
LIIVLGGFWISTQPSTPAPTTTALPQSTNPEQFLINPPDTTSLKAGGSSYKDSNNIYTFLYPNDYMLDESDPVHIRIFKRGPSSRVQSEITNGVLMVFESVILKDQNIEELTEERIQESTKTGTITQEKKAILLGTYPGFTYQTGGFGAATHLILQKDTNSPSAIIISYTINDPTNKNYGDEVAATLSTLELFK